MANDQDFYPKMTKEQRAIDGHRKWLEENSGIGDKERATLRNRYLKSFSLFLLIPLVFAVMLWYYL